MDSAYDSYKNYRYAIEDIGTAPIIALNQRIRIDAITSNPIRPCQGWHIYLPCWFRGGLLG